MGKAVQRALVTEASFRETRVWKSMNKFCRSWQVEKSGAESHALRCSSFVSSLSCSETLVGAEYIDYLLQITRPLLRELNVRSPGTIYSNKWIIVILSHAIFLCNCLINQPFWFDTAHTHGQTAWVVLPHLNYPLQPPVSTTAPPPIGPLPSASSNSLLAGGSRIRLV
jgi:hypothetical protein